MIAPLLPDDGVLATARTRAAAGGWAAVRELLYREAATARGSAELSALLGEALLRTGHAREASAWLGDAVPRIERVGDRVALRRAVNLAGAAAFELGELARAEGWFERALELARLDGDDLLQARATNNLGAIANVRGDREAALGLYQLAIPAYQRLGHPLGLAESWHNMAISFRHLGQWARADECEQRAMEFARAAQSARLLAMALVGRAELCLERGDAPLAAAQARRAARDFAAIPDPAREADALRLAGEAALATHDLAGAQECIARATELAEAHGSALIAAESLRARARLRRQLGELDGARRDALDAADRFDRLGLAEEARAAREIA